MVLPALTVSSGQLLLWLVCGLGVVALVAAVFQWCREVGFLKKALLDLVPEGRIRSREDLVRVKNYLSRRIRFDAERAGEKRPFLRQSASVTLKKGYGYCGENARVVILLFWLGGIRANRLYVDGPKWGHVLVEHEWPDGWKLFDAHGDPAVAFSDELVGNVASPEIEKLPNRHHQANPWQSFHRSALFHRIPFLRARARTRPWYWVTILMESPSLILAGASAFVALAAGVFLLV